MSGENRIISRWLPLMMLVVMIPVGQAAKLKLPHSDLSENEQILHVLNRLAFGPRPGDLDRIKKMGLASYLEQQLNPQMKAEPALEGKLEGLETLSMVSWELLSNYPDPNMLRQIRRSRNQQGQPERSPRTAGTDPQMSPQNPHRPGTGPVPERPAQSQMAAMQGPQRVVQQLVASKVLRGVESEWQLNEVMVDFWLNHFNVSFRKNLNRWLVTEYDRDVIRPHAWGKFKDLLTAVAQSPAMLMYLDNFSSSNPTPPITMFRPLRPYDGTSLSMFPQPRFANRGLNENYARELLELHTLGVDGGYTQNDVVEVARCFTGWTLIPPQQGGGGGSVFNAAMHDWGEKTVLGHRIPAGMGIEDGMQVIDILAHHPSTARFLSGKMVGYLLSDEPPENLVQRVSKVYKDSEGDIREMVRTIITSPEFFSSEYQRVKFKRPFEFLVSALRALDADVAPTPAVFGLLNSMGEIPFGCQPPTGYSDAASDWLNANQLVRRMNVSLMLASGRVPGIQVDVRRVHGDAPRDIGAAVDFYAQNLLGRNLSERERNALLAQVPKAGSAGSAKDPVARSIAAFILGSPDFQLQ